MRSNKKVVWLTDIRSWCFYSKANNVARLSKYIHFFIPIVGKSGNEVKAEIEKIDPDVIIGLSPACFNRLPNEYEKRAIIALTSRRSL